MPPFHFTKNLPLLDHAGSLGFDVAGTADPAVAAALATPDGAFPAGDVDVASVTLAAATDRPIAFGRGTDKISFSAKGSAFAGLGVYRNADRALAAVGTAPDDVVALRAVEFQLGADDALAVLRWGYGAEATANGAMALGAVGTATAQVTAAGEGLWAVLRRVPGIARTPARAVVQGLADNWVPPRHLVSVDQLDPGTWLVAETSGSLGVTLGAKVGYDFNWVREAGLGGLSGDIALRLQMGIDAAARFSVSGRCAVVVSRGTDARHLRVRLFRMKSRGFEATLNAALGVQGNQTMLPGKADDFIAAVFGVHGQQVLRDLAVLERWTDPSTPLSQLLADAGIDGAERLIATTAGITPEELAGKFDAVHATVGGLIGKWKALPHTVSSALLDLVRRNADLARVRALATTLSTTDATELAAFIEHELQGADFFHTPAGQLLEAVADGPVLALLGKPVAEINAVGAALLGVLDGSTVEAALVRFQQFVEAELRLEAVLPVVSSTDFAALDGYLRKKLATFLGATALDSHGVDQVRTLVSQLIGRRQEFYGKAVEALHRKYTFALNAAFSTTTTGQALLDVTIDCSRDEASAMALFQRAIRGNLDDLLRNPPAWVTVRTGMLTHGISRRAHIDVSLPYVEKKLAHVIESAASIEAVPHEGGLLLKVKASDTITAGNQRKSLLSVAMVLGAANPNGVRVHRDTLAMDYSLLYARRDLRRKDLRAQAGPAIRSYFGGQVPDLEQFLELVDRQVEACVPNGANVLANGLISLDVSLPAPTGERVGRAWLSLPDDAASPRYGDLSRGVQDAMKEALHTALFGGPDDYARLVPERLHVFLAYCALAPTAEARQQWYWNWPDVNARRQLLVSQATALRMRRLLLDAREVLTDDPDRARHFRPADVGAILSAVDPGDPFLHTLLATEREIVGDAVRAGLALARARTAAPSEAVKAFAEFGARFTEAFHSDLTTLFGPGFRALGTRVLLGAARALDPAAASMLDAADALLSFEFMKPAAPFNDAALLAAGHVQAADLACATRLVRIGA